MQLQGCCDQRWRGEVPLACFEVVRANLSDFDITSVFHLVFRDHLTAQDHSVPKHSFRRRAMQVPRRMTCLTLGQHRRSPVISCFGYSTSHAFASRLVTARDLPEFRAGKDRRTWCRWTKDEEDILTARYHNAEPLRHIASALQRTLRSVKHKKTFLGLKRPRAFSATHSKSWTTAELDRLSNMHRQGHQWTAIAAALGRTVDAVQQKHRKGRFQNQQLRWKDSEVELLLQLRRSGTNWAEIHQAMPHRSIEALSQKYESDLQQGGKEGFSLRPWTADETCLLLHLRRQHNLSFSIITWLLGNTHARSSANRKFLGLTRVRSNTPPTSQVKTSRATSGNGP